MVTARVDEPAQLRSRRAKVLSAVAAVAVVIVLTARSGGSGGTSAEQKRHEVCGELVANKAGISTLVDEARAAAQQDANLTNFAQALKAWGRSDGSLTAEQNHTIITTCRSEFKTGQNPGS